MKISYLYFCQNNQARKQPGGLSNPLETRLASMLGQSVSAQRQQGQLLGHDPPPPRMAASQTPTLSTAEVQACQGCCSALQTAYSMSVRNVYLYDELSGLLPAAQTNGCHSSRLIHQHMIYNTSDLEDLEGTLEITWLLSDPE